MSTGSSTLAARRGGFPRLRDARIRAKLAGLLFLPLAAVVGLAAVRLVDVGERASDAGQVADLAELGSDLSNLTRLVHDERMAALAYLGSPDTAATGFREAVKSVDAQVRVFRTSRAEITEVPSRVDDRLAGIDRELTALAETRAGINERNGLAATDVAERYSKTLAGLGGYEATLSQIAEPGDVADHLRAVAAFTKAEAAAAEQAAETYVARVTGDAGAERQRALIALQAVRADALTDFRSIARPQQVALVDSAFGDETLTEADGLVARLTGPAAASPADITALFTDVIELFRGVERQLEAQAVTAAEDGSTSSSQRATLEFVVVLLILIAALAMAFYLGRSLHLSVRRLREGALAVANRDLPDAVHRLQDAENLGDGGVDRIVAQTRDPIPVTESDEFGQVAEAFNMVHREAIRVAAEQAALRTSVSTMFLSLARRSQSLVDRMIGELDQIERLEEDPKRLARLFELDHLATRMRRNDENLLVLAGAEVGAPRREDALLIDALRAAQSEVELYHRIEFGTADTDVLVAAAAVNDVVRLIAELLDNATRFSPPNTVVVAHGGRSGDHAMVQVEDRGLGISADQMELINRRLAEPAQVDVSAFRLMGFAVIARLAARHGIGVELRPGYDGGTIAEVRIPADIVVMPGAPPAPVRAASWTRPGPPPQIATGAPRIPEPRPPIRSAPAEAPARPPIRPLLQPVAPPADLDLRPTPDRPPLPSRSPKPVETPDRAPLAARSPSPVETPLPTRSPMPVETPAGVTAPGWGAAMAALPSLPEVPPQAVPIQVEMQHSWFEGGDTPADQWGMPTAGYAPPPDRAPAVSVSAVPASSPPVAQRSPAPPPPPAPAPAAGEHNGVPKPRTSNEDRWRTAADEGWNRAMAAAAPRDGGITRSGLPKRVPQAQLVPGGVQSPQRAQNRRSPDEVRGLLSAYHRGVQRGRTDGVADTAAAAPRFPKESEQ
ncbi:sensor histidine kinase [Actinoplanes aureus]|uniref:histidine kinase n=1 Tax=Actinoplanes aureus TaxID=2792083 RepID=A0A931C4M5_9ACTN|nr:sensor histidine kinase [Actinoplanes aureus]MBG0563319.1 nitrate- and nitrite sensing domain-containing protein [Actinoplanes aureus]